MKFTIEILDKAGDTWRIQTIENVIGWRLYGTGQPDEAPMLVLRTDSTAPVSIESAAARAIA